MSNPGVKPALAVILGPTASGKTDLAMHVADACGAEIVNFDSVQVYRGFDIGSAKPSEDSRRAVPHHLIDVADAENEITAGTFAELARAAIAEIALRDKLPLLAGGTGFYLRALLDGLSPAPGRSETLRQRLAGSPALHRYLRRFDPAAAARIHPNDRQKLIRAVEMSMLAAQPATTVQSRPRAALTGYRVLKIGLNPPREALRERIAERTRRMFERGLIEETQRLLSSGVPSHAKPMQSLGYKQAMAVLAGNLSVENAIAECTLRTQQYAKRQMTWFRADPEITWIEDFGSSPAAQNTAMELVQSLHSIGVTSM